MWSQKHDDCGLNHLVLWVATARLAGEIAAKTEPRAIEAWYAADSERIFIELTNGVVMGFPYQLLQGLENGTPEQLAEVEVMPTGSALAKLAQRTKNVTLANKSLTYLVA